MASKSFDKWMDEVDARLQARIGLDSRDLADWRWHDAWEDSYTPREAVAEFCEEEGIPSFG